MSAVLIGCVEAFGGAAAVEELLERAGSTRSLEYLLDLSNWISYDEAVTLWRAGAHVTHHPQFARIVGETAARRLNASLLRSLGSPENVYRQIAMSASKFSTMVEFEAAQVGPGFAEIMALPLEGFPRSVEHCAWTAGMLTQSPVLFGLRPAVVEHEQCAAFGAPRCRYRIAWDSDDGNHGGDGSELVGALREQLDAMRDRLHSMFATASDLIDAGEIGDVLARITDRAALEVRAPRYLLAVRTHVGDSVHYHHKGFDEHEANHYAAQILEQHPAAFPESWLVVPVRSKRQDYGRLLALNERDRGFFPQERELFEVYARYAASALDGATALVEAKERYDQSSALLDLARALAEAGTSGEVARRLADAVPVVVDCDQVEVHLWDTDARELVRAPTREADEGEPPRWRPLPGGRLEGWLRDPRCEPIFANLEEDDPVLRDFLATRGAFASIIVPLTAPDSFLGLLMVSSPPNRHGSSRVQTCSTGSPASLLRRRSRSRTAGSSTRSPTRRSTTS